MKRLRFLTFVPGTGFWVAAGCGLAIAWFGLGLSGILTTSGPKSFLLSLILMFAAPVIILMVSACVRNVPRAAYVALTIAVVAILEAFIASQMLFRPGNTIFVIDGPALLRG